MQIVANKDFKWCVNYKTQEFKEGEIYNMPTPIAEKMVKSGYCTQAIDLIEKKRKNPVVENKMMNYELENKNQNETETATDSLAEKKVKKKRGRKPKINND